MGGNFVPFFFPFVGDTEYASTQYCILYACRFARESGNGVGKWRDRKSSRYGDCDNQHKHMDLRSIRTEIEGELCAVSGYQKL